jgi:hypothetical protein
MDAGLSRYAGEACLFRVVDTFFRYPSQILPSPTPSPAFFSDRIHLSHAVLLLFTPILYEFQKA